MLRYPNNLFEPETQILLHDITYQVTRELFVSCTPDLFLHLLRTVDKLIFFYFGRDEVLYDVSFLLPKTTLRDVLSKQCWFGSQPAHHVRYCTWRFSEVLCDVLLQHFLLEY